MSLNASNLSLPRELRRAVRARLTGLSGWDAYRESTLGGRSAADMTRADIIAACNTLGVDIATVALQIGATIGASNPNAPVNLSGHAPTMPAPSLAVVPATMPDTMPDTLESADPHALVRDALAPVRDMLGSKVLAALEASVTPLALAAVKPARVETKTVTVTLDATGAPVVPAVAPVTLAGERMASDVFQPLRTRAKASSSARIGSLPIPTCTGIAGEGDVPAWDAAYAWNPEVLGYLCLVAHLANSPDSAKRKRASLLLYGPAGTGKTTAAEVFASACGRPFFRIAIDRTTEPLELIGQRLPAPGGGTTFHEGALVAAMQVPYAVILIDEPSFLRPGSAAVLQTVMDRRYAVLKEDSNRRVDCAPGVMFICADNTNLTGDETGRYADTNAQNLALQDRMAYSVQVTYMSATTEARTLSAQSGIALQAAERMVNFAALTRNGAVGGTLTTGTSYRRLLAWADAVNLGVNSVDAFKTAIMNPTDPADREAMRGLEKNNVDHVMVDALASGVAPASLPAHGATVTPAGATAAAIFPDVDND